MSLVHSYILSARAGQEEALAAALGALGEAVKAVPGTQGTLVLRDRKDPRKFMFLEYWDEEESRLNASFYLPADALSDVMATVGEMPQMASYDRLAG